ncbi:MAG: glycoside hydrolase family 99-like domain-containing protein [Candidatus Omnitrophica bacterium]|nr:glycoside hydrolase family 99-like domain-containing protein [Candidatus Omnitrophota bacterium]
MIIGSVNSMVFHLLLISMISALAQPTSEAPKKEILVGVNYFAGWWEALPNKWHDSTGRDWRPDYPGRAPLLGMYNTQEAMDQEIRAASGNGVDFFLILWYPVHTIPNPEPGLVSLNAGVDQYVHSPESGRMKFAIEFCNHDPFVVKTDEEWQRCIQAWLPALGHPAYLKIDGKLFLKFHSLHHLYKHCGQDINLCRQRIESLREAVRKAGLGEMLIGCGVSAHEKIGAGHPACQLFEFTTTYMDVPTGDQTPQDHPYEEIADHAHQGRLAHAEDALPYIPYLPAGWNPRPWHDPRPCYQLPNREQWRHALEQIKHDLQGNPRLGFPHQKMFTIYAWNEYGEGGIVAPTQGDQAMKLEVIREVFPTQSIKP